MVYRQTARKWRRNVCTEIDDAPPSYKKSEQDLFPIHRHARHVGYLRRDKERHRTRSHRITHKKGMPTFCRKRFINQPPTSFRRSRWPDRWPGSRRTRNAKRRQQVKWMSERRRSQRDNYIITIWFQFITLGAADLANISPFFTSRRLGNLTSQRHGNISTQRHARAFSFPQTRQTFTSQRHGIFNVRDTGILLPRVAVSLLPKDMLILLLRDMLILLLRDMLILLLKDMLILLLRDMLILLLRDMVILLHRDMVIFFNS